MDGEEEEYRKPVMDEGNKARKGILLSFDFDIQQSACKFT